MSDNWIILIPEDPTWLAEPAQLEAGRQYLASIAPDAEEVTAHVNEQVRFYDCGGNFERILCPECHAEVDSEWWQGRMEEERVKGSPLKSYRLPCCGALRTLHELDYRWPQGFGRCAIEAMNPGIPSLADDHVRELERIAGTKLRVIYQHL